MARRKARKCAIYASQPLYSSQSDQNVEFQFSSTPFQIPKVVHVCQRKFVASVVSIQDDGSENLGKVFEIMSISQSTSEISQVPVYFDHLSRHTRLLMFVNGSS